MKIHWSSKSLKKKVEKYAKSNRTTKKRMASIRAAETFCDLEPVSAGKAHFLQGTLAGCFAIDIAERRNTKRLICEPHRPYEKNKNGQFIKQSIQEIKILKIVDDYH